VGLFLGESRIMSTQEDFLNEPPRKQGMSSTAKVLIILGSIAGVCLLACCGGVAFVGWKFQDFAKNFAANLSTNDPQEIRARTAKIVHIDIPEQFPPAVAIDVVFMKEILYGTLDKPNRPLLVIVEIDKNFLGAQGGGSAKQQREEILRQMRQQGQQAGNMNTELDEESSETREFTIDGEKVPFEFIKGTARGGGPTRQIVGVFPGREGMVMLMVMVPESDYDEAAIMRMLESIRLPRDESDDESTSGSEMPEKGDATAPASDDESAPAVEKDEKADGDATSESSP
jgi:hypothetical protein